MGGQIFLLVVGVSLLFWPGLLGPRADETHGRRLSQLRAGAPEAFFEERRSLEAYPPPRDGRGWRRGLGAAMIVVALALFGLNYRSEVAAEAERAALSDAREAVSASRDAVARVNPQEPASYQKARATLDRADVALAKSEQLSGH